MTDWKNPIDWTKPVSEFAATLGPRCPCSTRTIENLAGNVVWRAIDRGEWCGNNAKSYRTMGGEEHADGWCDACIEKTCEWCRWD